MIILQLNLADLDIAIMLVRWSLEITAARPESHIMIPGPAEASTATNTDIVVALGAASAAITGSAALRLDKERVMLDSSCDHGGCAGGSLL